ncbi:hypothetical protein X949_3103 [Burkholderia pseudomallei MSHR5609]|nr:hypothetical protein X949_3103 [Burkholderia pseudomallei MSHR5609]
MRENTTPPNGRATQPGANAGNAVNGRECRGRRGEWRVASGERLRIPRKARLAERERGRTQCSG